MKISGVYSISSFCKSGRVYIGSSVSIYDRWDNHKSLLKLNKHNNLKLQSHFNKYGENDLQFTVLREINVEELVKVEQHYIDTYMPYFNINQKAGKSCLGVKRSEENKRIKALVWTGRKHRPESIEKMRQTHLRIGPEVGPKSGASRKGVPSPKKGIPVSEKEAQRLRTINIGRKLSEEHKLSISKGVIKSCELRKQKVQQPVPQL